MNLTQKFFSVKNEIKNKRKYKVITFLGIKIKFRQKSYEIEQQIKSLCKKINKQKEQIKKQEIAIKAQNERITEQKEIIKEQKNKNKELNKIVKTLQSRANSLYTKENYKELLKKIRNKFQQKQIIKVVFLCNEINKWKNELLYKEFERSENFEPLVVVCPRYRTHAQTDLTLPDINEQYNYFEEKGYNVEYGYRNGEYINLREFNPDMVFYTQLVDVEEYHSPAIISEFALTFYTPYGYQLTDYTKNYIEKFHKLLFCYFCEDELNIKRFEDYSLLNSINCIPLGYLKNDEYHVKNNIDLNKYWKNPNGYKVIYSPHQTIDDSAGYKFSTFMQNKDFILNLAKNYPETTWIFRPHPMLKYILERENYMSASEIEQYWHEWEKIGNIYMGADYFDVFKTSDLMITDCASFLAEYLPSKKPLIRLCRNDSMPLNQLGEKIISEYYCTYSNEELENAFKMLVIDKNDPKKEMREKLAEEFFDYNEPVAAKIYNHIHNLISKDY